MSEMPEAQEFQAARLENGVRSALITAALLPNRGRLFAGCISISVFQDPRSALTIAPRIGAAYRSPSAMTDQPQRKPDGRETPDLELLRQMAGGDATAFARFYDRHSALLFGIAIHVLGDREEAEEALQDAARLIWENARGYEPSLGRPSSWAVVVTRNKAIDRLRALRRRKEGVARLVTALSADDLAKSTTASNSVIDQESGAALRQALARLPADQRAAIELAFFNGLSQTEIATHLEQPLGTIKARIRRGMITLRDALEDSL